ncbi:MAG: aldo/keto reductase [Spirochaetales bacterium]|nr:aldo/keto reductase [Spirochaetales bacterium]
MNRGPLFYKKTWAGNAQLKINEQKIMGLIAIFRTFLYSYAMRNKSILNEKAPMEYRRFGKTDKMISVITLGGMRFKHVWDDPADVIPDDSLEDCVAAIKLALDSGINLIETAYGYKKSEKLFGLALNRELKLPRESYYLMTKNAPADHDEMLRHVEKQLETLGTDRLDFFAVHGINNEEAYETTMKKGGALGALEKLKAQGVIGHIGFSTHGQLKLILKTILTEAFEFANIHYYYFNQRNFAAVQMAQSLDMGLFIISPNDKGGQLYKAPDLLKKITAPLSPIQWNARFCLSHSSVHTLSFGITEADHFREMMGIFPTTIPLSQKDAEILHKLDAQLLKDPFARYEGFEFEAGPEDVNVPEMLRFRRMWKCFDMLDFGRYRYNDFQPDNYWFPGSFPTEESLKRIDFSRAPSGIPLREMILETHEALYVEKK